MPEKIIVKKARVHNLKNITVEIPRGKLTVLTGISGSGKSSLAFDTIYAEGQRRYVESLSAYARQFLGVMDKPDVDSILGLSPAISIDQKTASHNPRSTVGTVTEIYDYMRLLYSRAGRAHCHICGKPVSTQTADQIAEQILALGNMHEAGCNGAISGSSLNFEPKSFVQAGNLNHKQESTNHQKSDQAEHAKGGVNIILLAPMIKDKKGEHKSALLEINKAGFSRVRLDGCLMSIEEALDKNIDKKKKHTIDVVVDRLMIPSQILSTGALPALSERSEPKGRRAGTGRCYALSKPVACGHRAVPCACRHEPPQSEEGGGEFKARLADSLETALDFGNGVVIVHEAETNKDILFSTAFACAECGVNLIPLEPRNFSFNSPHGACPTCGGLGEKLEIDPCLVIPNKRLSIAEGAIRPWSRSAMSGWFSKILKAAAEHYGFSVNEPVSKLTKQQLDIVLYGAKDELNIDWVSEKFQGEINTSFEGVIPNLMRRHKETESDFMRSEIEKYMIVKECLECGGRRLMPEVLAVTVGGFSIDKVVRMNIEQALEFFRRLNKKLSEKEKKIAKQILKEIIERLGFLQNVGLSYLTLDRTASTLSGGEAQRIRLATQIGSSLVGVIYILDEPSIGLHQKDNAKLIKTLEHLRDIGNTVIVVEHDEETIRSADHIIDIGPGAGAHGGHVVFFGTPKELEKSSRSITGKYLSGKKKIIPPKRYRKGSGKKLVIKKASAHNLKNIDVEIPLGNFVAITGVSGSGKSTLMTDILAKALSKHFYNSRDIPGKHKGITGLEYIDKVISIDQSPIGRTPRSNPATYTGLFTQIREVFAKTAEARIRGYGPGRFSFNVKGGRCSACQGDGMVKIEMNFLPDVYVECEECKGKRYNSQALEIHYKNKTIADVLDMTVESAVSFFRNIPSARNKLETLNAVGLSYIKLGQPATTLSGGEAQRVKLALELAKRSTGKTLYILDEPTTGLHFDDVKKLLNVLHALADKGNTVLIIEHNLDVIKSVDYIIDLGPEGGDKGGRIIAQGTPISVSKNKKSYTGQYLKKAL